MLKIVMNVVLVGGWCWLFSQIIRAHFFPHVRKPGDAASRVMTLGTLFILFASVYPQYDAEGIFSIGGFVVVMGSAIATGRDRERQSAHCAASR